MTYHQLHLPHFHLPTPVDAALYLSAILLGMLIVWLETKEGMLAEQPPENLNELLRLGINQLEKMAEIERLQL